MSDFHFIRPEWFFALIPLVWMLWQLNRQKLGNHGWQQIIPAHLVQHLMQGKQATEHRPFWLLAIIWLIIVTALAGPAWEKLPQPVYQTNTGKVLVMDMSQSMLATDLTPNRLTKARFKAIDLIDKIDDADMGLIAYSGDAFVISPLTADSKNLTALIPSLSPNIMPLIGSNAYAALDLADELLKNAGYSKGEIYWLTDGIDQNELNDIRQLLSASQHRVSILGVGTAQGAPIKQSSGELLKDSRGSIIIPKLNDSHLRSIAKATGGAYTRITSTAIDIQTLAQQELISREAKKEQDEQLHQGDQFREFGPIMVMLILPFVAYAFRRGLVLVLVLTSSLLLSTPAPLQAAQAAQTPNTDVAQGQKSSAPSWWTNMWQTQDQQAAEQFEQQNYSDAAQMFDNPQWKGSSLYKSGDYEGALKEFQQANDATSLYNQGNAHAQLQNFDEAIKAYENALEQNPDMEDAQKNLELIKQMQQRQQEQQNQDGEQQDGENQDQQNQDQQSQDQQNQDQQSQDQQGDGSQQDQQNQSEQQDQQEQKEQQDSKQGEQNDAQPREQQPQQGDQDPQAQQKEQPEEQSVPKNQKQGEEDQQKGEQQLKPSDEQTTEEKEQMQEIQQLIRKINDDPAVLLRNKMQLEYQKRKYQNSSPPGAKSW